MNNNLNTTRLRMELARINKSHTWLSEKLGYKSRQAFWYHIKRNSSKDVPKIAKILAVDPNDLIVRQ